MNRLPQITSPRFEPYALGAGDRLAIWAFRCAQQGTRICSGPASATSLIRDLHEATESLRIAHEHMLRDQGKGITVAAMGTLGTTRDERRLLKAAACAQLNADDLVDNFLFRLAPVAHLRNCLTQAVIMLATSLGASGYWLSPPVRWESFLRA